MTDEHPEPVPASDPDSQRRARARKNNTRQGWLYILIGVALGVLAVIGLVGDDPGVLDWLLLALALINLGVGTMALLRPEPRLDDPEPRLDDPEP